MARSLAALLLLAWALAQGLTPREVQVLERLVAEALPRDPAYLRALADLRPPAPPWASWGPSPPRRGPPCPGTTARSPPPTASR